MADDVICSAPPRCTNRVTRRVFWYCPDHGGKVGPTLMLCGYHEPPDSPFVCNVSTYWCWTALEIADSSDPRSMERWLTAGAEWTDG